MLFQINSMWQILGWVLVFAGLIITNEIERRTKKGGIFFFGIVYTPCGTLHKSVSHMMVSS